MMQAQEAADALFGIYARAVGCHWGAVARFDYEEAMMWSVVAGVALQLAVGVEMLDGITAHDLARWADDGGMA